MSIDKETAIVTGAVSGIGLAFTKWLLEQGYRVVMADLNEERGVELAKELGNDTLFIRCDVSDWDSQAAMFKKAHKWSGHIDLFIANAGIEEREWFYNLPGTKDDEPIKPDTTVVEVNLYSSLYGLRLFRHYTRKSKRDGKFARMITTASMAGFYAFPAAPIYSAAKHGVSLFSCEVEATAYMLTFSGVIGGRTDSVDLI